MVARPVVVVGAGQAGSDTAAALRAGGFTDPVTLVGEEGTAPYQRPPLSKSYLAGTGPAGELRLRPDSFYPSQDIELVAADPAVRIDRPGRTLVLASGRRLRYRALVLATGARPRRLPVPGATLAGVLSLRSLADASALRERLRTGAELVVVGAGLLGLEVAATARTLGLAVTVVELAPRPMARVVSPPASGYVTRLHRARGVRVLLGRAVARLRGDPAGQVRLVELAGGERIPADLVLVGVGAAPDTGLAAGAGLAVGDGVLVDGWLRTSDPAIHAIGDCARFPDRWTGRRLRLESVPNATDQARHVAAVLCGRPKRFDALPRGWTEQYGARLQVAGHTGDPDRTVIAGDPATGRFSVFCFRGGRWLGTESVNRPADHAISHRVLAAGDARLSPDEVARPGFDLKRSLAARRPGLPRKEPTP